MLSKAFSLADAGVALRSFLDAAISSVLRSSVGRSQWGELLHILDAKVTSSGDRDLLNSGEVFNGTPDQLRLDSTIRRLASGESK